MLCCSYFLWDVYLHKNAAFLTHKGQTVYIHPYNIAGPVLYTRPSQFASVYYCDSVLHPHGRLQCDPTDHKCTHTNDSSYMYMYVYTGWLLSKQAVYTVCAESSAYVLYKNNNNIINIMRAIWRLKRTAVTTVVCMNLHSPTLKYSAARRCYITTMLFVRAYNNNVHSHIHTAIALHHTWDLF